VTVLFLHGWGGNENTFAHIRRFYESTAKCVFVNFDCNPNTIRTLDTYVEQVEEVIRQKNIDKCHIIAHSFGARVAVLLCRRNPELVDSMVLTGAAGIRPRFNFFTWLKIRWYKLTGIGKGSSDYQKLSPAGKRTFQNIIGRDLSEEISGISIPTLLIFGRTDKLTPLYMAKRWTKLQKGSRLVIYKRSGHFCFIDEPARFIKDSWEFLNGA